MAIPDYQAIMLPLLKLASDGKDHQLQSAVDSLADQFGLTEDERRELLPSGRQQRFSNRVSWARTYMDKARLLESPMRGTFRITDRGQTVLTQNPLEINNKFLHQFDELLPFIPLAMWIHPRLTLLSRKTRLKKIPLRRVLNWPTGRSGKSLRL